jgi:thiol-disulfide isomerase/thioredoxin
MRRSFVRSPYLWTILGVMAVVGIAWLGRESYQPIITGSVAPDFRYGTLTGDELALSDLVDRVVLVNVWATWCAPCLQEMPSMQRLYDELAVEGLEILAVSIDAPLGEDDPFGRPGGDLEAFRERLGLTFPILHNPTGDIQRLYQTTGVPESFLIGKDGVIVKKVAGPTEWDAPQNQELIRRLLAS